MNWNKQSVEEALPEILQMRAVEDAWYDNNSKCLTLRTRKGVLKHKSVFFPLAQVDIQMRKNIWGDMRPYFKYTGGFWAWFFNGHPTMVKNRIGKSEFRSGCIGGYSDDFGEAKTIPEYILITLLMLQTIEHESRDTEEELFFEIFLPIFFFVVGTLLVAYLLK